MPHISVVMTAYNRAAQLRQTLESIRRQSYSDYEIVVVEDGDDGGKTKTIADVHGARYYQRKKRPEGLFANPSQVINIGLKHALGKIVILQNAECAHQSNVLEQMSCMPDNDVWFASVQSTNQDGTLGNWYCHPIYSRRPYFFCGGIWRHKLISIGGMDEDYVGYGYEDDDLASRLQYINMQFVWHNHIVAHHLWHENSAMACSADNADLLRRKRMSLPIDGPIRNRGREWGVCD